VLKDAGADKDQELFDQVKKLLEVTEKYDPDLPAANGINIKEAKAYALKINKVIATGTWINIEKSEFTGDIEIGEVQTSQPAKKANSIRLEAIIQEATAIRLDKASAKDINIHLGDNICLSPVL
jgi:hypothetical protein